MAGTSSSDKIVLVPGDDDVCMGRGNAVNFREGNANFRQLARDNATSYGEAPTNDKTTKEDIATNIVKEIKRRGGRFLRAISVTGTDGAVVAAWEVVDDETAIAKAKQTLRDSVAAIRKDTAERFAATSAASGGTWPPGEYSQHPMAAGNRGSFQALADQHQAAPQAHFDDLYRNLVSGGGGRGFNNNINLFALGGGDSSVSHNLHWDRVVMPHPLRSNLFQQPIDNRQVRPMVQQSVEESKRPDGNALLQQLRTMGSRISDTTFRTEAARGATAESTTAPLSPLDVTLLECLHRLHQYFILRRHFLLSQLSSDTRQQFLASEGLSNESSSRISAFDRGHVPFGRSLRVGDILSATLSETQLSQEALARQAAVHAVEQGNPRRMPAAVAPREWTVTALGRQKKSESSSSSSDEHRAPRRVDINNKKPKRRRTYQGDDNDDDDKSN